MNTKVYFIPRKITRSADATQLVIRWNNGTKQSFPLRKLRLACPCAHCVDEWSGKPLLDPTTVPESILPMNLYSVGRYAMAIEWSDGHKTGIYSYDLLYELGEES
jgi:DUF971 family protein